MQRNDWLSSWQDPFYFAKHEKKEWVNVIGGYRYNAIRNGNELVDPMIIDHVVRAIPVEGVVNTGSWYNSPQARFWLDKPKQTIWQRFVSWLNK